MNSAGVYAITNRTTNRVYIGGSQNVQKRWRDHRRSASECRHHSHSFQSDWGKHGEEDFDFRVLLWCSRDNLRMYEQACMSRFLSYYNVSPCADSQFGLEFREEARAKMSAAAKRTRNRLGRPHTEESKRKISESRKGKGGGQRTKERCTNISKSLATLTEDQVRAIRARRLAGEQYKSIAEDYPLTWSGIADVCNRTYKWVK
jgi:group I intron endonuclease